MGRRDTPGADALGRPSRRGFLKIATCAGVSAALGVAASGPDFEEAAPGEVELRLDAWRVRPGAQVSLTAHASAPESAWSKRAAGGLLMHVVAVDAAGRVVDRLGQVEAQAEARGQWAGDVHVPSRSLRANEESYLLAVMLRHGDGQMTVSDPIEVICTPQCAGA